MDKEVLKIIFSIAVLFFILLTMGLGILMLRGKRVLIYHKISAGITFLLALISAILNLLK